MHIEIDSDVKKQSSCYVRERVCLNGGLDVYGPTVQGVCRAY